MSINAINGVRENNSGPFWKWQKLIRLQGLSSKHWFLFECQSPTTIFFKLHRAKIGFDAFQRKALYCETKCLSWKHWFLFQSQSPTTILTIWLRLLARWCNTGSPTMRSFWISKNCHCRWGCTINDQSTIWKSDCTDWSAVSHEPITFSKSDWLVAYRRMIPHKGNDLTMMQATRHST